MCARLATTPGGQRKGAFHFFAGQHISSLFSEMRHPLQWLPCSSHIDTSDVSLPDSRINPLE